MFIMMLSRCRSADQLYNKQKTKLSNPFLVRFDALDKRIVKDMELAEFYASNNLEGGCGGLRTMRVTFFMGEKKFGPAEEQTKGNREIEKITGKKEIAQLASKKGNWSAKTSYELLAILTHKSLMTGTVDRGENIIFLTSQRSLSNSLCKM